jgi:hypothetical protein
MTVKRWGNDNDRENQRHAAENLSQCESTTNPKWISLGLNPDLLGEEHRVLKCKAMSRTVTNDKVIPSKVV